MGWSRTTCPTVPMGSPGQGVFWAGKLLFNHVEPQGWWFIPLWWRGRMLRVGWIQAGASEPLLCLLPGFLRGLSQGAETLRLSLLLLHPWCYLGIDGSCRSRGISSAFPIPIWISLCFPPIADNPWGWAPRSSVRSEERDANLFQGRGRAKLPQGAGWGLAAC